MTRSVIIVNWCSGEWLRKTLQGLSQQTLMPDRIVVIDNASDDSSFQGIEEIIPTIEVVKEKANLGFAKANNIGLRMLETSDWIVLLNPDAIPAPDWLEKLAEAAERFPQYDFFACRMLNADSPDFLDGAGGDSFHTSGLVWRKGHGRLERGVAENFVECFSPCAAAAMYKTEALIQVGGFDEEFFCYLEDVDLGFRLRLAGYRCLYVPVASVRHGGSVSTGKKSDFSVFYGHRNIVWTYVKNMPGLLFWIYLPQHFLLNVMTILILALRGQGSVGVKAKRDAFAALPAIWQKRKKVQAGRTVSVMDIWKVMSKGFSIFRRD